MTAGDVFPAEMPDDLPFPIDPLDDDTAERLLGGRLPPEDAPPSYAEVARFLRAAAGPPTPGELAGQPAALAAFRTAREPVRGPARGPGRKRPAGAVRAGGGGRPAGAGRAAGRARPAGAGRAGARARLVAVALAGTLAVGGLWIAAGAQTAPGLRSPTGGPGTGGSGSATSGSLRPAMPVTGPLTAGRPPALPSDRDRAAVRLGAGTSDGGADHRTHPSHPRKPPRGKPPKPKADKPKADKPKPKKR
jgi:hypothetical protein